MPGERHDLVVADRDPGDVLDRDGFLVIGQNVGRDPAYQAKRRVQSGEHAWHRLISQSDHDPEPREGQPGHEQKRGVLQFGTELVISSDGSIAALLGASPGASTAAPIMLEMLERCFPQQAAACSPNSRK